MQKTAFTRSGTAWLAAAAAALMLLSAAPARAASPGDELDQGLKVGQPIPNQLETQDQTGTQRSFRTLRGKKGLILLFNRSFNW